MEEAKITGDIASETPSRVTTDDLLMLIGARTVEALNYERLYKEVLQRVQVFPALQERIKTLERTTKELSDRNASLDRALTDARRQAQVATKRAEDAETKLADVMQAKATVEGSLAATRTELEKVKAEYEALQVKLQKGTSKAKKRKK